MPEVASPAKNAQVKSFVIDSLRVKYNYLHICSCADSAMLIRNAAELFSEFLCHSCRDVTGVKVREQIIY